MRALTISGLIILLAGCGGGSESPAADAVEPSMPFAEESREEMLGGRPHAGRRR